MRAAIIIFLIVAVGCSSGSKNNDWIEFKDPMHEVCDSLRVMDSLLRIYLPKAEVRNFFIDRNNNLVVNSKEYDNFTAIEANNYQVKLDYMFDTSINKRLLRLLKYLNSNYIDGACTVRGLDIFVFTYKIDPRDRPENDKIIMLIKDLNPETSFLFRIVDNNECMVLLKLRMEIWKKAK